MASGAPSVLCMTAHHEKHPADGYISMNDAAAYLGVSRRTLERLIGSRRLRHYRLGRTIRLRRKDLDEYMESLAVDRIDLRSWRL